MQIQEIKRKGHNIYTITVKHKRLFRKDKIEVIDVYRAGDLFYYCANGNYTSGMSDTIWNLATHLEGFEPLIINN